MNFAYLVKQLRGTTTILFPNSEVETTALLRARTCIALKWRLKLMHARETTSKDWMEYSDNPSLPSMNLNLDGIDNEVVAIVPYVPYAPPNYQPGRYLINVRSYENLVLFESVYLRSSISYMEKNPWILQQFPELLRDHPNIMKQLEGA